MWGDILSVFSESYSEITGSIPSNHKLLISLIFFTAIIVFYSVFTFYFYKFLARKNILNLNLSQYNKGKHDSVIGLFAILFYIVEYIIIMPIVTFFWFVVLAMFIMLISKEPAATILTLSAALVASVRVTSYVNEGLSKELAKLLPLILLGTFILQPDFFVISDFLSRLSDLPSLFSIIPYYLLFILIVELVMRLSDFFTRIFRQKAE